MSSFWKHAEEIFLAAREGGSDDCEMSILVGRDGSIQMLCGADGELEPLRLDCGASAAYRISRRDGRVRLEARSADESCRFETRPRAHRMPSMPPDFPQYLTIQ